MHEVYKEYTCFAKKALYIPGAESASPAAATTAYSNFFATKAKVEGIWLRVACASAAANKQDNRKEHIHTLTHLWLRFAQ